VQEGRKEERCRMVKKEDRKDGRQAGKQEERKE
jgi:hypothetical protein